MLPIPTQQKCGHSLKSCAILPPGRTALEIVREDGSISNDIKEVLQRWHADIGALFSGLQSNPYFAFDEKFYSEVLAKKQEFESLSPEDQKESSSYNNDGLNCELLYREVSNAIDQARPGKFFLNIPNEAMKNENAKLLLYNFFKLCFSTGLNPTEWDFSDIKPIPKKGQDDRDPLQNRCITIICCVAKIY